MLVKTRALVLHTVKYNDTHNVVEMLTESQGRVSFYVAIPKSAKAKIKRQYFLPLTLLEIEFERHQQTSMQRLKYVNASIPLSSLVTSPYKLTIVLFLAEFLTHATRGEQENRPLFMFIWNSLLWLENVSSNYSNFHLVFMLHLPLYLGFAPNMDDSDGAFFDLQEGMFVDSVPNHTHYLDVEESCRLRTLMRLQYATMHLYLLSREERNHCLEIALSYYRLHIPNFPVLKSLPILQEIMSS